MQATTTTKWGEEGEGVGGVLCGRVAVVERGQLTDIR